MKSQQEFMEGLQDLVRIGKTNGDVLTKQEVEDYFSEYNLDDQKMGLIGAYMAENQIRIEGVLPENPVEEEEETIVSEDLPSAALSMYMEEIREMHGMDGEKEQELALIMERGDQEAANQLLEGNLEVIAKMSDQYRGKGVQTGDLIQEGNLAFFCAMSEYDSKQLGSFHEYAMGKAQKAMEDAISENALSTRPARKMVQQVNRLNDLATAMAKELGREAKPEELAEKMHLTVDEIKDLMKVSLDAISVIDQGQES